MGTDIVVVEDVHGAALDELAEQFRVVTRPDAWSRPDTVLALLADARALVVRNRTQVGRDLLARAPRLEIVARAGAGIDNVDVTAADDLGVVVTAAVGANAVSVAELALGLALALARQIVAHDQRIRDGQWIRQPGVELAGRTWGVVGLGATGRATARVARAMGMQVVGHDPFQGTVPADLPAGVEVLALPDLLARSHVVSLHLAASPQSDKLVDERFLQGMRSDAFLINVARGELVDEAALLRALDVDALAGAALDVRRSEPPGTEPPESAALTRHPRVVSTAHVGGITEEAQERVVTMIAEDLANVLQGRPAVHAVGLRRLPDVARRVGAAAPT